MVRPVNLEHRICALFMNSKYDFVRSKLWLSIGFLIQAYILLKIIPQLKG